MSRTPVVALAACALALAGCGSPGPEDAVEVADRWVAAVAEDRPADACALMLPSATRSLQVKYLDDRDGPCEELVGAYGDRLGEEKLRVLEDPGLEFSGEVQNDRLGVFPADPRYQFEVLLMELDDGEWKLASVGIAPD